MNRESSDKIKRDKKRYYRRRRPRKRPHDTDKSKKSDPTFERVMGTGRLDREEIKRIIFTELQDVFARISWVPFIFAGFFTFVFVFLVQVFLRAIVTPETSMTYGGLALTILIAWGAGVVAGFVARSHAVNRIRTKMIVLGVDEGSRAEETPESPQESRKTRKT
jgi:hypothetical protein